MTRRGPARFAQALHQPRIVLAGVQPPRAAGGLQPSRIRCWSGCVSSRSRPIISTNSSWCASPACCGQLRSGVETASEDGLTPGEQLPLIHERVSRAGRGADRAAGGSCRRNCWRRHIAIRRARRRSARPKSSGSTSISSMHIFPGADAAGGRSRPSLPLHSQSRPDAGAANWRISPPARACRLWCACRSRSTVSSACLMRPGGGARLVLLEAVIVTHIQKLFPGYHGQGAGPVPGHPRQRSRSRGRGGRPGPAVRDRAEAPPARLGDPAGDRRPHARGNARLRRRGTGRRAGGDHRARRHAGAQGPVGSRRPAAARPQIHAL